MLQAQLNRSVRRYVKRKKISLKIRRIFGSRNASAGPRDEKLHVDQRMLQQNCELAVALNQAKEDSAALANEVNILNAEIMDLRTQLTELKSQREAEIELSQKMNEEEFQRRLAEYLEPQKKHLNDALDHIVGMSVSLEAAMKLATAPGRRSKSLQENFFANRPRPLPSVQGFRSKKTKKNSVAEVIPMVMGHNIHRPKIRIPKLDIAEVNNILRNSGASREHHGHELEETHGEENDSEEETENDANDSEEEEAEDRPQPQRIREPQPPSMEAIVEETEDEEMEDNSGPTVLLLPRIVLDRVTLSPRHSQERRQTFKTLSPSRRRTVSRRSSVSPKESRFPPQPVQAEPDSPTKLPAETLKLSLQDSSLADTSLTTPESTPIKPNPSKKRVTFHAKPSLSPIATLNPSHVSVVDTSSRELQVVVEDVSRTFETMSSGGDSTSVHGLTEAESTLKAGNSNELSETMDEFMLRMNDVDPLEGPSWLFDDSGRRRNRKPVSKKKVQKRKQTSLSTKQVDPPVSTRTSLRHTVSVEDLSVGQKSEMDSTLTEPVNCGIESRETSIVLGVHASSINDTGSRENSLEMGGRSRRRAAAAAMGSLKEPSMNKKLRQGDKISSTIYTSEHKIKHSKQKKKPKK